MTKELISFQNQEYPIAFKQAEINFPNYEDLKNNVEEIAGRYDGYVVTPDSLPYDKKTKAELNKIRKSLSERRLEIVRQASQPVDQFNQNIKDLDKIIKSAVDQINTGIKAFDEKAKKDKYQQNLVQLGKIAQEYGISLQKLEYDPKWDNKTAKWSSIEQSARKQFEEIAEKEKAEKDAQQVIIDKADSYTKPAMIPSAYLAMLDYKPLSEILKQMDSDHDYLIKQAKLQAETRKQEIKDIKKQGDKYIDSQTGEVVDKVHTVTLKLTGSLDQLKALSNFIKDWGISYEKVD